MTESDYLSPSAVAARYPGRGGRPLHPSTVVRWILAGVRTADGNRVRLKAVRLGFSWKTTPAWLNEFVAATTRATLPSDAPTRTPSEVRASSEAAARELELAGV